MKTCPKCKAENLLEGARFCAVCGAELETPDSIAPPKRNIEPEERLDFVITEASGTSAPQLFGNEKQDQKSVEKEEGIEIKSPANLMDPAVGAETTPPLKLADIPPDFPGTRPDDSDSSLETENNFIPPPAYDENQGSVEDVPGEPISRNESGEDANQVQLPTPPKLAAVVTPRVSTAWQADNTPRPLREFPGEKREKTETGKLPPEAEANQLTPIDDPSLHQPEVKKSTKMRGLAYFHNNYIKVVGQPYLHENDEIIINEKPYLLRPMKLSNRFKMGALAAVFVIALATVASFFISPTTGGDGEIIGVILNEYGQPYVGGAQVTISELGKRTSSNAQGFFRFEDVPTGTYEFVYEMSGRVGKGNATIVGGQISMMTFGNLQGRQPARATETVSTPTRENQAQTPPTPVKPAAGSPSAKSSSTSSFGKIKLESNIEDAKFSVDGKVLGAGNNTYARITPGNHKIQVSKDGYSDHVEVVSVEADKTTNIKAILSPRVTAEKAKTAEDYLAEGNAAYSKGQNQAAVASYTKALEMSPNLIEAYEKRAAGYGRLNDKGKAAADNIRLGEIYRMKGQPDKAVQYFTTAENLDAGNKLALVGRAGARLDRNEYRAAAVDYLAAVEMDENFYPALLGAGICEYKLGKNKSADKYLKKAKKVNPSDPFVYHYMMLNYVADDDIKNLRKTFSEFKTVASPAELNDFQLANQFEPVRRLIKDEE